MSKPWDAFIESVKALDTAMATFIASITKGFTHD